jgi:hypothetical protein
MTTSDGISKITKNPMLKARLASALWSVPSHLGGSTVSHRR